MAYFIDGPEAKIIRTGDTTVDLHIFAGEVYTALEPHRLFPRSGLTQYITLVDTDGKEKAILRNLANLDKDSRIAVEGCLEEYYLIPKILRLNGTLERFGFVTWDCETDHGHRAFRIKNRHADIKLLYDGRVLVRDVDDNRYEIENVSAMDKHSQKLLSYEL